MSEANRVPEWIPSNEEDRLQALGYTSTGISLRQGEREMLLEAIEADPNRMSFEKETNFLWSSATNVVQVDTAEPSLMRRFVLHDYFRLRHITAVTDDSDKTGERIDAQEFRECTTETNQNPTIDSVYSVSGLGPLGLLTVTMEPRSATGHANIVSNRVLENDPRKDDGGDSP